MGTGTGASKTRNQSPISNCATVFSERHHDFIDVDDVPACWRGLDVTVEVDARAEEAAVLRLRDEVAAVETGKGTAKRRRLRKR